ncbi:unnamed protein product [Withania somnifera]
MSHPNSDQTPLPENSSPSSTTPENPNPGENQSPPTTTENRKKKPESENEEDSDLIRQPKRRKNCPTSLDKFDLVNSNSNFGFSFSFDSKFVGCSTPEVTPKFGSFNRVKPGSVKDPKSEETVLKEEEKSDVIVEKNSLGLLTVD